MAVVRCPTCGAPVELPPGALGAKMECAACRAAPRPRTLPEFPAPPEPPPGTQPARRWLLLGAATAVVLAGVVALVLVWRGAPAPEDPTAARRALMARYGDWTSRGKPLRRWARMFRGGTGDREEATPALLAAGKPAVPFLVDLMGARRAETRAAAAVALVTMARGGRHDGAAVNPCPEALEALLAALEDPDPLIRLHAVAALDAHPIDGGRATPALRRAADHDPDPLAREAAQRALARREPP